MWPMELYTMNLPPGDGVRDSSSVWGDVTGIIEGFGVLEQALFFGGARLVVGVLVLGLTQRTGLQVVQTTRRSPVISLCIGLPSLLVVTGLTYTGFLLSTTNIGVMFAIPLVCFGVLTLPAATVFGYTAFGRAVSSRVGAQSVAAGLLTGALIGALSALVQPIGLILTALLMAFGLGSGVRVLFAGGNLGRYDERVVPPTNRV